MNDIKDPNWQEWEIELQEFVDDNDVNLANIEKITINKVMRGICWERYAFRLGKKEDKVS